MISNQFISADPSLSVWLCASAGTGKTKVLVDRVLRMLLRGDPPSSILCLTYTKAAAMEMQIRIQKVLAQWNRCNDDALQQSLAVLLGTPPSLEETVRARTLLATLLDSVEGVKIQTIHAFCQSLLSRFPQEAGLVAAPEVMDERTRMELINEAHRRLLVAASGTSSDKALTHAVHHLASRMADVTVQKLLEEMARQHLLLRALTDGAFDESALLPMMYDGLGVTQSDTPHSIIQAFQQSTVPLEHDVRATIAALGSGGKTVESLAKTLSDWLESSGDEAAFKALSKAFLTAEGEPKTVRAICTETFAKNNPAHADTLQRFQQSIYQAHDQCAALDVARFTQSVLRVASSVLEFYRDLKSARGLHDYDDLIADTLKLLSTSGMCEWVMAKLGYSIRHILVDEAQDTSPQQWQLVRLLTQELMVPDALPDGQRTLFVVGDPKQSIFKFQGADPYAFSAMQHYFSAWFERSNQRFETLSLEQSFRSSKAVLALVDAVCAVPHVADAIGQERVVHEVYRSDCEGHVCLWPVIQVQKPELLKPWEVNEPNYQPFDANEALAKQIADTVADWLHNGRMLTSQQRTISADDIMILLRTRAPLASKINRHLLLRGVAVAGADRIALTEHLAVQDILAIAQWCLLPDDDLILATVLKGPWCEWNEDALFALAYNRGDASLWQRLGASDDAFHQETCIRLTRFYEQSRTLKPYEWIHFLLTNEGGLTALLSHFGAEAQDICEELLEQALLFESQHTPVLQLFVAWMRTQSFNTKRELVEGSGGVRVMTIHAAKGLEAPIVIVPIINRGASSADALLLDWHKDHTVCYVVPPAADVPLKIEALKANQAHLRDQEEYRLLYVALTRARDELHIAGALSREGWNKNSWYPLLESVLHNNTAFPDLSDSGLDSDASSAYQLSRVIHL